MLSKKLALILIGSIILVVLSVVLIVVSNANKTYTVTFDSSGGSIHEAQVLSKKDEIELPVPKKEGYEFLEWYYLKDDIEVKVDDEFVLKEDTTLNARWKIRQYKLNFFVDEGGEIASINYNFNQIPSRPADPLKSGYLFSDWYEDSDFLKVYDFSKVPNKDFTIYAKYERIEKLINYVLDEGTNNSKNPSSYNLEDDTINLYNPSKEGYNFKGWYLDDIFSSDAINSIQTSNFIEVNLYAKWEAILYSVTYVLDGGTNGSNTNNYTIKTPTITLAQATKEGYSFKGWYDNSNLTGNVVTHIALGTKLNIVLYAKWEINTYEIIYDLDDGTNGSNPTTYTIKTPTIILEEAKQEGYTFVGWFDNIDLTGEPVTMISLNTTGNIHLFAKWTVNQYIISYGIITSEYNENVSVPLYLDETLIKISAGETHIAALTSEGRLFTWGQNDRGQLGNATKVTSTTPIDITQQFNLSEDEIITIISVGSSYTSALTNKGRLFMWGSNGDGRYGDGTTISVSTPKDVTSFFDLNETEKLVNIELGSGHSSALTNENRIFMWGFNMHGRLGDGTKISRYTPLDVTHQFDLIEGENIIDVSLGSASSLLTSQGRVFTWGANYEGQLGDGTTTARFSPIDITSNFSLSENESIIDISLGDLHSSALTNEGRLFIWGTNYEGQLGDGTQTNRSLPTDITTHFALNEDEVIKESILGIHHSSALTSEGRLFTWGNNDFGQLIDGSITRRLFPVDITLKFSLGEGESIMQAALSLFNTSVITSEGKLYGAGRNFFGEIADGTTTTKHVPTKSLLYRPTKVQVDSYDYLAHVVEYTPTLTGSTFSGWYTDIHMNSPYVFTTMKAENINLYGYWILND